MWKRIAVIVLKRSSLTKRKTNANVLKVNPFNRMGDVFPVIFLATLIQRLVNVRCAPSDKSFLWIN